jgi:hypothetical protein
MADGSHSAVSKRVAAQYERYIYPTPLDEWSAVDDFTLHNIQHNFMARRKDDDSRWRIDFDDSDCLNYKPVPHVSLKSLGDGNFQRGAAKFSLGPAQQLLLQSCDGKTSIAALADKLDGQAPVDDRRAMAQTFFRTMWRLGHFYFRTG